MELTVLTPTYNRAHCLSNLYESLLKQTNKEFEWLIVDDGSSDGTEEFVKKLESAPFSVRYIKKENGGKHTALNVGIKEISNDLTFIVDSDDFLTPDAVQTVLDVHKKYKNTPRLCGYSFLRVFPNGQINGKPFKKDEWIANLIDARINSDDAGSDKAEVYYTNVLRKYTFPEYPGEKFLGEDIVWIRIAKKYDMVHVNKGIYVGQYLDEGLTSNRRMHNIKSPQGCMNRAKEFICPEMKLKYRIKGAVQYIVYGKFAGIKLSELIRSSPDKLLVIVV
ncbi:MAG: glycosyltransferase family 2 protein, partial [Clostridium sp.]|nr:glycosyltransferase family 2 protein [Clostridium sp.]